MITNGLTAVVASTETEVQAIQEDWHAFASRQAAMVSVQYDAARFRAEISTLADRMAPYVVLFRDTSGPRGLIVGKKTTRKVVCRFGYLGFSVATLRCLDVQHCGIMTDRSDEAQAAVMKHLAELQVSGAVEYIFINHVPVHHEMFARFRELQPDREVSDTHWIFHLEQTYDETVKGFSGKMRYTLRREDRILRDAFRGDVQLRRWEKESEVGEFCKVAAKIASQTYQAGLGVGFADTPLWRAFLATEARLGRMNCYTLDCDGVSIAFQVGVIHAKVYLLEEMAFLPRYVRLSPGKVLLVRAIDDLCGLGVEAIDYGFGDGGYKQMFGSERIDEVTFHFYGRTLKPQIAKLAERVCSAATYPIGRVAERVGITNHLKKKWRRRLQAATDPKPN